MAAIHRHAPIHHVAARLLPDGARDLRVPLPQQLAAARVQGVDHAPGTRGVHHAVHFEGEVRIPAVDDGQGGGTPFLDHVHGTVRVRGGPG